MNEEACMDHFYPFHRCSFRDYVYRKYSKTLFILF